MKLVSISKESMMALSAKSTIPKITDREILIWRKIGVVHWKDTWMEKKWWVQPGRFGMECRIYVYISICFKLSQR